VPAAAQRSFDIALRALEAGRLDEAQRGFTALAASHPDLGGAHANLGLIHRKAGRLPESATALERAVEASPSQALFHNQLGITYRLMGRFEKAREAYEKALELDPGLPDAVLNLAILHDLYLWDGSQALALYERYLAQSPQRDEVVYKWSVDLKNRLARQSAAAGKEKQP
jgi:Flp pilus assembly protein TadD